MSLSSIVIVLSVFGCIASLVWWAVDIFSNTTNKEGNEIESAAGTPEAAQAAPGKQRLRLDRTALLVALLGVVVVCGTFPICMGSRASLNPLQSIANGRLQTTARNAIEFDTRNDGIVVSTYFRHAFDKSVIVFDLRSVSGDNSPIDVFRVFLDFAEQLQDKRYDFVELAYNSDAKFRIEGSYFQQLGRERRNQNPAYTIRTFSENLQTPAGLPAYSQWTGGMLGVLTRQMEDFNDFHEKWYLDDMVRGFSAASN